MVINGKEQLFLLKYCPLLYGCKYLHHHQVQFFRHLIIQKKMFVSGCLGASLTISSFIITLNFWGTITSVAIGYLCAQLINTIQCFYLIFTSLKYSIRPLLNHLMIPMLISVIVFVILLVYSSLFSFNDILIDFFAKGFFGFSLFFILYQLFGEYDLVLLFKTKVLKRKYRI